MSPNYETPTLPSAWSEKSLGPSTARAVDFELRMELVVAAALLGLLLIEAVVWIFGR